jgi:hypothetical protein
MVPFRFHGSGSTTHLGVNLLWVGFRVHRLGVWRQARCGGSISS